MFYQDVLFGGFDHDRNGCLSTSRSVRVGAVILHGLGFLYVVVVGLRIATSLQSIHAVLSHDSVGLWSPATVSFIMLVVASVP